MYFFLPESETKEIIILNFENRKHYNILNIYNFTNTDTYYKNNTKEIKEEDFNNKNKKNSKAFCHLKSPKDLKD